MLPIDPIVPIHLIDRIVVIAPMVPIHLDLIAVTHRIHPEVTAAMAHTRQEAIVPIHQEVQVLQVALHPEVAVSII